MGGRVIAGWVLASAIIWACKPNPLPGSAEPAQNPSPPASGGAGGSASNDVWAAGPAEVVYRFDGHAWLPWASGASGPLNAISVVTADHAWAVGAGGALVHFDGTRWSPAFNATADLYAVSAGWAVGAQGTAWELSGGKWVPVSTGSAQSLRAVCQSGGHVFI